MSEATQTEIQPIRNRPHVLVDRDRVDDIRKIGNIDTSGILAEGSSGWLMNGTMPNGMDTVVRLALDPENITGSHYQKDAQLLKEASERTLFVPLYYGHGVTKVPGYEGAFPYTAMEQIKGKTLTEFMHPDIIDIQTSLDILKTIARGVDELLGDGQQDPLISTDLKPSNIMIREQNNRPVLIDFEVATKEGHRLNLKPGEMQGTLPYAGPELTKEDSIITRELNTWQLANIAFEMLTHEKFFNVENKWGILYRYSSQERFDEFLQQRLKQVGLPTATQEVLAKGLSYNPDARYHSATEFVTALDTAERTYVQFKRGVPKPLTARREQSSRPGRSHELKDSSHPKRGKYIARHAPGKHRQLKPVG